MADLQDQFQLKALGHQADAFNSKIEGYKALSDEDLLYKYSRVSYLFERAIERMEPHQTFQEDMLIMRTVLLDRMAVRDILRHAQGTDLQLKDPDTNTKVNSEAQ